MLEEHSCNAFGGARLRPAAGSYSHVNIGKTARGEGAQMIRFWLREISEALHDAIRLMMLMRASTSWDQRQKGRPPLDFDER